jgi:O-methyltransferase
MINKGGENIGGLKLLWYYRMFKRFREFTMVDRNAYIANLCLVERALAAPGLDAGCIIECGTWRGGMAAGLLTVGGTSREYHFFDSFMGLPPASVEDGEEARQWQANKDGPRFFNNCTATMEEFMMVVGTVDIPPKHVHVYKGFFEETFPDFQAPPISVLRLDADWYNSTMMCLQKFWDTLLPGAIILIDDYYDWEGCRKAVHSFLAQRNAREAIRQSCFGRVCYIVKMI